MGLTLYEPAPTPGNERLREQAVLASGALEAKDDPALQAIVERARRQFGTTMAALSILHADWQYLIAASGLLPGVYSRRTSFCGHMLTEHGPVFCVPDARRDPRFAGNPAVMEGHGVRFYAGAAIRDEAGVILGTLCVFDPHPREKCPPAAEALLTGLAREVQERLRVVERAVAPAAYA